MSSVKKHNRVFALDALRGVAALAVVLFHYTVKFPEFYPAAAKSPFEFTFGFYGVHLFFMISGFVILMSLEHSKGKGFIRSRFLRLYPLYWACVIFTYAVMSLTNIIPFGISPLELLVNLTMAQGYLRVEDVDGVYWSLTYELGFYAFMYGVFRVGLHRYVAYIPVVMAGLAALFIVAKPYIPHPLHYLLVFNAYGHLFACGMALFLIRQRGRNWMWVAVIIAAPLIQYLYDGAAGLIVVAIAAAAMSAAALLVDAKHKIEAPFIWLGAISYALYLTHQMMGYVMLAALESAGLPALLAIFITAACALALASLLTYGVERPVVKFLKARI